jgi:hypothetical protein
MARGNIDRLLEEAGWKVQDNKKIDFNVGTEMRWSGRHSVKQPMFAESHNAVLKTLGTS